MPDIGNTLREARLKRGLSIAEVENAIKVRRRYIEALEQNDFEVLPGPTVVKGFLRSYSTFLKVDPELILAEYRGQYEPQREEIGPLRTEMSQQKRTKTSAERKKKRVRRTQRGYVGAAVVAVIIIVIIAYFTARSGRGNGGVVLGADNLPTTVSSAISTTISVDSTSTSVTQEVGSTSTSSNVPTTTGENVNMVLSVKEGDCWLVVREDGESGAELYAGVLSAGGQQSFDTAKRYWLRVGLPEALTISVNGTPHTIDGDFGTFQVTEAGPEREETTSTETTQ